jgi:MscS family membrane protein
MIAGFVIMIDRPFRVGDRIELPTGQIGDVHKIGLRSTGIMNFENNLIIIPNAELAKGRIVNISFPNDATRVLLRFDLALGTDTAKVRSLLLQLADEHPDILRDPAPQVFVTSLNESGVQCTLVGRCSNYLKQFEIETGLREKVHELFMKARISFGVSQRIVRMKQEA